MGFVLIVYRFRGRLKNAFFDSLAISRVLVIGGVHTPDSLKSCLCVCLGIRRQADPMKQLALEVVARTLDPAQISLLAEEFDRADNNNNGEVSAPRHLRNSLSGTCFFYARAASRRPVRSRCPLVKP